MSNTNALYGKTKKEAYENGALDGVSEARNYLWNAIDTLDTALESTHLPHDAKIALRTLTQWRDEE